MNTSETKERDGYSLAAYPEIARAISEDGAIRIIDGRYRSGFVSMEDLANCIALGSLAVEERCGMRFAVLPK